MIARPLFLGYRANVANFVAEAPLSYQNTKKAIAVNATTNVTNTTARLKRLICRL
jgi:hypothetical protein